MHRRASPRALPYIGSASPVLCVPALLFVAWPRGRWHSGAKVAAPPEPIRGSRSTLPAARRWALTAPQEVEMSLPVAASSSAVAAAASLARVGRAPAAAVSLAAPRCAGVAARPAGRGSAARAAAGSVGAAAAASEEVSFAIVGDLHLDPKDMELFYEARTQLRSALTDSTVRQSLAASATNACRRRPRAFRACAARRATSRGRCARGRTRVVPCACGVRALCTLSKAPPDPAPWYLPWSAGRGAAGRAPDPAGRPGRVRRQAWLQSVLRAGVRVLRVRGTTRQRHAPAARPLTRPRRFRRCAAASRRCRTAW